MSRVGWIEDRLLLSAKARNAVGIRIVDHALAIADEAPKAWLPEDFADLD